MITNSVYFIINPISGGKKKTKLPKLIDEYFSTLNWITKVKFTEHENHAGELVKEAIELGYEIVCAVGGDGTINQVATGIIGTKTKLAIIPKGSGNGIANHLHIPKNEKKALALIVNKHTSTIDVGKCNQNYFLCTCGFGFDAKIALSFSELKSRGLQSYLQSIAQNFKEYQVQTFKILINNQTITKKLFILSVANAAQYGNQTIIAPNASVVDGKLELCSIPKPNFTSSLFLIFYLLIKKINLYSHYERHSFTNCRVENIEEFYVHVDGEPLLKIKSAEIKIIPKALEVIHPENCFI